MTPWLRGLPCDISTTYICFILFSPLIMKKSKGALSAQRLSKVPGACTELDISHLICHVFYTSNDEDGWKLCTSLLLCLLLDKKQPVSDIHSLLCSKRLQTYQHVLYCNMKNQVLQFTYFMLRRNGWSESV